MSNVSEEGKILKTFRTVAVVGLSPKSERTSFKVGAYLKKHGYKIIPVNPMAVEILGEKSYPDLSSIPEPIDAVDILRRSEEVVPVVEEAIRVGAKAVWMQEGVTSKEAADLAQDAGLLVVMDKCMRKEHRKLHK